MAQLIRFFLIAYGLSWLIWSPLWLPAFGVMGLPVLPLNHALGGLGPMLAAFICSAREDGKAGVGRSLRSMVDARAPSLMAVALLAPVVLLAVGMLFVEGPFDAGGILRTKEFPAMGFISFLLYNLFFFGFGEEVGWRGFALPRMQQSMNALWASVLLTFFWALWHWPLFLYRPGYTSMDAAGITGWLFSLLTGSVLLTWLFNSSRGSLLVVAIFHATVDIAFTCEAATPAVVGILGALITMWGIAVVFIFKPKDLSRIPRVIE
ncbi:MAG: type II CAAX endopeptidase family protein [Flavobacteriales bacterium]